MAFFRNVIEIGIAGAYSDADAPVRMTSRDLALDIDRAVITNKTVSAVPLSPTNHVTVPDFVDCQSAAKTPVPDVSVAVTIDHGAHDAVSAIVTVSPTNITIVVLLDVTVHLGTIINEKDGAVPMFVGVNAMAVIVLSTTVPVTVMS